MTDMGCLVDLEKEGSVVGVLGVVVRGEGKEEDYAFSIFLRNMRQIIYNGVTRFLKSLVLTKILNSTTSHAITLR